MEYSGKLYGCISGVYFELEESASDIDNLRAENANLDSLCKIRKDVNLRLSLECDEQAKRINDLEVQLIQERKANLEFVRKAVDYGWNCGHYGIGCDSDEWIKNNLQRIDV
jgi:hypothetical protein